MIKLAHGIWVIVADGEKALFLRNEGDTVHPNLTVVREMANDNPATHDQGTDRPGRMSDPGSDHFSAMEETDWHRIEKARFAETVAAKLYKLAYAGKLGKIVLVAPPTVLGDMRKKLHQQVSDLIVAEIPKTLTNHPVDQIEKHLLAA